MNLITSLVKLIPRVDYFDRWISYLEMQFNHDMSSHAHAQRIREDFLSGVRSGVNGTPTFYINGTRYDGSWDLETLENTHIWVQLRKMSSKIHHSTIAIVSCIVRHSGWLLVVLISSEPCRKTLTVLRHTFQYVTFIFIYNYLIIVAYMIRYQNDSQGEWTTTWAISKEKLQS